MELKIIETDTYSQLGQDLWVLEETNNKRGGFFVDIGATDGITINNTYLLEKDFGWKGVLAEPNEVYHCDLESNRDGDEAHIYYGAVYTESDKTVRFICPKASDLATIVGYGEDDEHAENRKLGEIIETETMSLFDLLEWANAPENVDYLSIDTEGSEYDILKAFFDNPKSTKYSINLITVEHNYTEARKKILELLNENGYELVKSVKWDDFYKRRA